MKKVLIFDFDGTFYTGKNIYCKIHGFINQFKRSFLSNLSDSEYEKVVKENPSWLDAYSGADVAEHIYSFIDKYPTYNIKINEFRKWLINYIEPVVIDKEQTVDSSYLEKLCSSYHVYIVSNSDIIHIRHYMKQLNINPAWFKAIISNQYIKRDRTKKHYYKDILTWEKCEPSNAFVFGDSYSSDILPAEKLGIPAFLITDAREIPEIVENAIKNY